RRRDKVEDNRPERGHEKSSYGSGPVFAPRTTVQALPNAWRRVKTDEQQTARVSRRIRAVGRRAVTTAPPDPVESAKLAGLRYVDDERTPGISRVGRQNRFRYVGPNGRTIADRAELQRIRALAIPPAWTAV